MVIQYPYNQLIPMACQITWESRVAGFLILRLSNHWLNNAIDTFFPTNLVTAQNYVVCQSGGNHDLFNTWLLLVMWLFHNQVDTLNIYICNDFVILFHPVSDYYFGLSNNSSPGYAKLLSYAACHGDLTSWCNVRWTSLYISHFFDIHL